MRTGWPTASRAAWVGSTPNWARKPPLATTVSSGAPTATWAPLVTTSCETTPAIGEAMT